MTSCHTWNNGIEIDHIYSGGILGLVTDKLSVGLLLP